MTPVSALFLFFPLLFLFPSESVLSFLLLCVRLRLAFLPFSLSFFRAGPLVEFGGLSSLAARTLARKIPLQAEACGQLMGR